MTHISEEAQERLTNLHTLIKLIIVLLGWKRNLHSTCIKILTCKELKISVYRVKMKAFV